MTTSARRFWYNLAHCPDPARSTSGAWLFDGNQDFETMISDLKQEDQTRTTAACFELLGAIWDDKYFDKFELSDRGDINAYCPDASRSSSGAWLLDRRLVPETRIQEMKFEDSSRTTADCFRLLGAEWDANFFSSQWLVNVGPSDTTFARFDPERTKVERVVLPIPNAAGVEESRRGAWFTGAWSMTLQQKAAANRFKRDQPELVWWQCNQRAGGKWHYCKSISVRCSLLDLFDDSL